MAMSILDGMFVRDAEEVRKLCFSAYSIAFLGKITNFALT